MSRHLSRIVGAVLVAALAVPAAYGQSDAETRRENETLRARVRDLEAELAAARKRIADLEAMIKQMSLQRPGTMPLPEPPKFTIDESDPAASPGAALEALKADYVEALEDVEIGEDENDRKRRNYLARGQGVGESRGNRKFTLPISWHVRVKPVDGDRGTWHEITAVDPVTDAPLGEPFQAALPRTVARMMEGRPVEKHVFVLKGTLEPRLAVNPERAAVGPFDKPPFIGPFAEFVYEVDVRGLSLREEKKDEPAEKKS